MKIENQNTFTVMALERDLANTIYLNLRIWKINYSAMTCEEKFIFNDIGKTIQRMPHIPFISGS